MFTCQPIITTINDATISRFNSFSIVRIQHSHTQKTITYTCACVLIMFYIIKFMVSTEIRFLRIFTYRATFLFYSNTLYLKNKDYKRYIIISITILFGIKSYFSFIFKDLHTFLNSFHLILK